MNDEPNQLYLSRAGIRELAELLREIPDLADDLAIARTRQAKLGARGDYRMRHRPSEQPLPYNPAAARAADHLHAVLVGWVRLVCEQRGLGYAGSTTTAGLSRWLDKNLIALAMTEGVGGAPQEIGQAVRAATMIVCPPTTAIVFDSAMVEQARAHRLNASGIATLAKELGDEYRNLTVRRVQTLRDSGKITPVPGPWAPDWPEMFVVGEVLDQHLAYPSRSRRKVGSSAG
ncbi:hypothetical protein [Nocardia xishanensis]|uniref:hypothetical protein n=1 Tax=Nocardia xishanensis TaxID=238964 RepID=UPI000831BE42|nr:hypothetical protein [Nocardia xishanensis]